MSYETRARARAEYFGPEMLDVIGTVVQLIDAEIRKARDMSGAEVMALLLALRDPLAKVRADATLVEKPRSDEEET